jgi:hypothetical protein
VLVERLRRDGVALAYTEAGSGAPPLLLLHCWCGDHTHWLRGPDYQEVQRYAEEFFLSTDAPTSRRGSSPVCRRPPACDAVRLGAAPAGLGRRGGGRGRPGASAPHQFRDAAIRHLPLPGADPAAGYRPNRGRRAFHHPVRSRAGQRQIERYLVNIAARPGLSPANRDSAKHALATDEELWKARSFPEPNAARGRPRWEPTGEPFRRAVPQTGPPF